jgi:hypothetical protein
MLEQSREGKDISKHNEASTQWQSKENTYGIYKQKEPHGTKLISKKSFTRSSKAWKGICWNLSLQ